jgi:two-component system phosphate regulon sensor histidine kinase PhoR
MFASMVAHEVKSPLAAIESYLGLVLDGVVGDDPERRRQMLERCLLRARTLRTMVTELISLVAVETGNFALKRSPIEVDAIVSDVVSSWQDRARERSIELELETSPEGTQEVLADRDALRSIVSNVVDNGIKYTPEGGRVSVSVANEGLYVRISVRDTGIGMTRDERERVFEEFYRVKNDRTADIPGTGLGLSLVKRLVDLHQGTISVQSEPGRGSEFTIHLPVGE